MINPMSLKGKTILITGASDGIGKATSILASQLGAKIILVARNEEKLESVKTSLEGEGHKWYSYDLKNVEGIEALIKTIVSDNGKLDGFVHCAGISKMRPLKMTNYEFLKDIMTINFYSFIELARCITNRGNYNEGMSVVSMSSAAAIKGNKSQIAYSSSKAAIDGAIRAMSKELSDKKIRINSIIAGFVKTDMYEKYKIIAGKEDGDSRFDIYCLGVAEPIDIANAITFLLSDASRIITGTGLVVDSGATT